MMSGFRFNGIHSKAKYIKTIRSNRVLVPERKHTYIVIPHSDNVILVPDKSKQPFTLTIHCYLEIPSTKSIFDIGREWTEWLTDSDWNQLIFDDDPNYYYEAISTTAITVEDLRRRKSNEIALDFLCKPTMKAVGT